MTIPNDVKKVIKAALKFRQSLGYSIYQADLYDSVDKLSNKSLKMIEEGQKQ